MFLMSPYSHIPSITISITIVRWEDHNIVTQQETHQYHVAGGDVHVRVGGLLAPGGDAAPCRGADGWTAVAELRRHAVDPGGDGLRALSWRFDRHTLPAELLQEGRRGQISHCCHVVMVDTVALFYLGTFKGNKTLKPATQFHFDEWRVKSISCFSVES